MALTRSYNKGACAAGYIPLMNAVYSHLELKSTATLTNLFLVLLHRRPKEVVSIDRLGREGTLSNSSLGAQLENSGCSLTPCLQR